MKNKIIMKYKALKENIRDIYLNSILDKISRGISVSSGEKEYLDNYGKKEEDNDFSHLSSIQAFQKIEELIKENKTIYCDLYDRSGKIGLKITDIGIEHGKKLITLRGEENKVELVDNSLYNIYFILKDNKYSLQKQDEYYEKILVSDDN